MEQPYNFVLMGYQVGWKLQANDPIYIIEAKVLAQQNFVDNTLSRLWAKRYAHKFRFNAPRRIETYHQFVCELLGAPSYKGECVIKNKHSHDVRDSMTLSQLIPNSESRRLFASPIRAARPRSRKRRSIASANACGSGGATNPFLSFVTSSSTPPASLAVRTGLLA